MTRERDRVLCRGCDRTQANLHKRAIALAEENRYDEMQSRLVKLNKYLM